MQDISEGMDEKSLRRLEFPVILEKLAQQAESDTAKEKCRALRPSCNLYEIRRWQQETDEAYRYVMAKGAPSFYGLTDIRPVVGRTAIGASLSMHELLQVCSCLSCAASVKAYSRREASMTGTFENLDPMFEGLSAVKTLDLEIRRCILDDEHMSDDASAKLHHIRKQIADQEMRIQSELQRMVHSEAYKSVLQDQLVTIRQGRYCLPVKSEHRSSISGMVHDQSSSGSTLFIEPMAVVELNNNIAGLKVDEEEEVRRILQELSQQVHAHETELMSNFKLLSSLDFIFAKGRLAREEEAVMPSFSEEGKIDLPNARHPLIDKKKVVPISIRLGEDFTTLVITGPNTGGKTVSLKTLGLLSLMGQAGLHIPAGDSSVLTVLSNVYADIGDEQSIEQSLSTFSSHMVNIVEILKKADYRSLVLFDELGAGTDPTEGAALAQSILEYLRQRGILTAATTHYSELKVYALETEGVENASCEFDVNTLMPTYKLLIGLPGKSNAFAISRRLGLEEDIITYASHLLEESDVKFEDMISDLEVRRSELEKEKAEVDRLHAEVEELTRTAEKQKADLEHQQTVILDKAREQAKIILQQAKAEADHTISRMNKIIQRGGMADMSALEKERSSIREKADRMSRSLEEQEDRRESFSDADLIAGTKVRIRGFDEPVSLLTGPDSRGSLKAQAGILKMTIHKDDILGVVKEDAMGNPRRRSRYSPSPYAYSTQTDVGTGKSSSIHAELDLRGLMTDEGVAELDKYLDDAMLSGLGQVRIIHGKGTGAMRNAVQAYLKHSPYVQTYRLGETGEGGDGVTVVTLKNQH